MKRTVSFPQGALCVSSAIYIFCLWGSCPQVTDKGYFLLVLILGLFTIVARRQPSVCADDGSTFASLCQFVLLLTAGLLLVGIWNLPLHLAQKGLSVAAWFAAMYSVARCSSSRIKKA
jgi:Predicted membrane protein